MSARLNWVDVNDGVISPKPMTGKAMVALMRREAPPSWRAGIVLKDEETIEVDGMWGKVVLKGEKP